MYYITRKEKIYFLKNAENVVKMEEEKEEYCFFPPPKRKIKKEKKLSVEDQEPEMIDLIWDEENPCRGSEEEMVFPEKEDGSPFL